MNDELKNVLICAWKHHNLFEYQNKCNTTCFELFFYVRATQIKWINCVGLEPKLAHCVWVQLSNVGTLIIANTLGIPPNANKCKHMHNESE